jgi:pantetheine-phosphate adenylyltransferase
MTKHDLIVCGGTFDLLHKGHKAFLKNILDQSEKVILGLTSNLYVQSFKNGFFISDFKNRKENLEQYLDSIGSKDRISIVPIDNAYGPLLTSDNNFQAIAATPETQKTAEEINSKRKSVGLSELEIIVIPFVMAEDGKPISSSRIRNGEINRDGRLYVKNTWLNRNLFLPDNLRSKLQKPFGEIYSDVSQNIIGSKTIAIGDITVQKFIHSASSRQDTEPFLSIVDFQVQRQKQFDKIEDLGFKNNEEIVKVNNPAGAITFELFNAIQNAFKTKENKIVLVDGEEDLAFLPVMLIAPLNYQVYYGQPNQGLVQVKVTEENKEKIYQLLSRFEIAS